MVSKPVHTVPNPKGGWSVKKEEASRASGHYNTKAEALKAGKELAKKGETEHVIHTKDGKISEKNSYGNDKCPPKG